MRQVKQTINKPKPTLGVKTPPVSVGLWVFIYQE